MGPGSAPGFAALVRDDSELGFEKRVCRILRGALLRRRFLQPRDLGSEKRDAFVELLDRKQREVLPDLVRNLLLRPVILVHRHLGPPCLSASGPVASPSWAG